MPKKPNSKVLKTARWDKVNTKASQNNWLQRLEAETGEANAEIFSEFTEEKFKESLGENWYNVFMYHKHHNVKVTNIIVIAGKSTQKTKAAKKWQYFMMCKYPWLNCFDTRSTLNLKDEMMKHWRDSARFLGVENGLTFLAEKTQEASESNYFVRDKNRKDNQEISFLSFNKLLQMGGFTTSTGYGVITHNDELSDPNDALKGKSMDKDEFIATLKFTDSKNEEIMISTGKKLEPNEPRNLYTQNRYNDNDPLTRYCNLHFPWDYHLVENENGKVENLPGAKQWMLKDVVNNNFIVHYVEKAEEGWEALDNTLIVYASKMSNQHLLKDEDWKQKQLDLIEKGRPEDLAIIIGDLFEGYDGLDKIYHYNRKDKIERQEFEEHYAKYCDSVDIAIDLDFNRQVRIRPKYHVSKYVKGIKIYRTIRERAYWVKCNGTSPDGWSTKLYFDQTHNLLKTISEYVKKTMPHVNKVKILVDDKGANWVQQLNFGIGKNSFWTARIVTFSRRWTIDLRPPLISGMQDNGYIIDIEDPTNEALHVSYWGAKVAPSSKYEKKVAKRLEKDRNPDVDDWNSDEYGVYPAISRYYCNIRATKLLLSLGGENVWRD